MSKLNKQINESFFNPLLHFLPLFTFLVVDDFSGIKTAWYVSISVAILVSFYVYFYYKSIFQWLLDSTSIFLLVVTCISFFPYQIIPAVFHPIIAEYLALMLLILSLVFKNEVEKRINKFRTKTIKMDNNLNEHFRIIKILTLILFVFVHSFFIIASLNFDNKELYIKYLHQIYLAVLFFTVVYEMIRVTVIRVRLFREEWWPIVNETGKVIGSIQHQNSINSSKKYMHPIVRIMLIDDNRIFLRQRCRNEAISPGMWDTVLSNHVKMNETVDQCIQRSLIEGFGNHNLNTLFLSNYIHETTTENQYTFLFIACSRPELTLNTSETERSKWWTLRQIEDNLDTGIFTDNFVSELEQVKRSGMLETGMCDCKCRLKEVVYEKMNFISPSTCI